MVKRATVLSVLLLCVVQFSYSQTLSDIDRLNFREDRARVRQLKRIQHEKANALPGQSGMTTTVGEDYDVSYYKLNIGVDHIAETLDANVIMAGLALTDDFHLVTVNFFNDLTVDSVKSVGQNLSFVHQGGELAVELPDTLSNGESFYINTFYHGTPQSYEWGTFGFDYHSQGPVVWTLSQPDYSRSWWPCKDVAWDKADSVDVWMTVDESLIATSQGTLREVIDNGNGTKTYKWHHAYPVSTYLVSMAISNYATFAHWYHTDLGDSMEVRYWVFPQDSVNAEEDFSITVPSIEVFVDAFQIEYPYLLEKYAHSAFPWGGGMEHATNTSYGSMLITGDHRFDWLLVHEAAHMWWGDMVTCYDWINTWLNEGFATYGEAIWFESLGGAAGLQNYMQTLAVPGYFSGPIYDPDDWFNNTVYDKGAWALHMLRHVVGDAVFFDILHEWGTNPSYAYSAVTTEDFVAVCEDLSGAQLDWFFDEWVYGMYRPDYEYWWVEEEDQGTWDVHLHIDQTQTSVPAFKMPVDIRLTFAATETTIVVWDSLPAQDFYFTFQEDPVNLLFDPDGWILKHIHQIPPVGTEGNDPGSPPVPLAFTLSQNHPNPFNPNTTISYTVGAENSVPKKEPLGVKLSIFDTRGRLVAQLVDEIQDPGYYRVTWDGRNTTGNAVSSGIYFYLLEAGEHRITRKMVLLK